MTPYRCDSCFDRGYYILYRNGNKVSFGERTEMPCPHCKGAWSYDTKTLDKRFREALAWFRTSTPPENGFRLSQYKTIDDPAKFWAHLKEEIAMDNIYALERIREDVIGIQVMFDGDDF